MKRLTSLFTICLAGAGIAAIMAGCDKTKPYDVLMAESQVHFIGAKFQSYQMAVNPAPVYKINIGTTDVSSSARTVTVNVTSPTGAVAGTHYSLVGGNTVTIPAGQATVALDVQGVYSQYTSGRKDTLVFTLAQPDIKPAKFTDTIKLVLRGPCFEGDVTLSAFAGNWVANETFGTSAYGPYACTIPAASITPLTATTATIVVTNIWDNGWGPITFTLDWTDPANRTAVVVPQAAIPGSNAGDINSAYAGQTVAVRAHATGGPGTFSACNNTFTLRMQLGVTGVGYFGSLYTVNLTR